MSLCVQAPLAAGESAAGGGNGPGSSVQQQAAADVKYKALVARYPDKPAVQLFTKQLADGIQHEFELKSGKARFVSTQRFDPKQLPLIPPGERGRLREFIIGSAMGVECSFPNKKTIVETVVGRQGGDVQLYESCIWLLLVLWRGVPDKVKKANSAFADLLATVGPAAGP